MIVASPIWHTRCNRHRCIAGHRPRNSGQEVRGDCLHLHACHSCTPPTYRMGLQNGGLDVITWYAVDASTYRKLKATDHDVPILTLLSVAGYVDLEEAAA